MKKVMLLLVILVGVSFAYHEFDVPKKAYKKVTMEYFSNVESRTEPDSTVYLYYDKDGIEIYRKVKKGCSNVIGSIGADSLSVHVVEWESTTLETMIDTMIYNDLDSVIVVW